MFDENVSQLIIRGNKKYIITGDGYLATKKKKKKKKVMIVFMKNVIVSI